MSPPETYPVWNQRPMAEYRAYPEQQNSPWVTLSEASRPVVAPQYVPYPNDTMAYEYGSTSYIDSTPGRMFKAPIGPSPEEDPNAPFYVPRRAPPMYPDYKLYSQAPPAQHLPPNRDEEEVQWRSGAQANDYQNEMDVDQGYSHRSSRSMGHDRKASNFPYPKQTVPRDRSKERHAPPNIARPRRHNGNAPANRPRRGTSSMNNHRQGSREASVPIPNTSQHIRQYSHDEPTPVRPLSRPDLTPNSPVSRDQSLPSPKSRTISPSVPTIPTAPRMWNSSPQHKMKDTHASHAMSILDHMLERQSLEQILHLWDCTGLGPNPYEFPQWRGWTEKTRQETASPKQIHGFQ